MPNIKKVDKALKAPENTKKVMGRPSKYSEALAEEICIAIATSTEGLHFLCKKNNHWPEPCNVYRWLNDPEKANFRTMFYMAREQQADLLADEIIAIADDGSNDKMLIQRNDGKVIEVEDREVTNRSKLRVDARKWKAARLAPRTYGDNIKLTGDKENPVVHQIVGMEVI